MLVDDKSNNKLFILTLIITILLIRFFSLLLNKPYFYLFELKIYYFYIGLLISIFSIFGLLFFKGKKFRISSYISFFGFGLIFDQIIFLIGEEAGNWKYWSINSILGVIIIILIVTLYLFLVNKLTNIKVDFDNKKIEIDIILVISFLLFISIILPRIFVYLFPGRSLHIFNFEIHHIYYGIVILFIGLIIVLKQFPKSNIINYIRYGNINIAHILIPIGSGLIIDEFFFRLMGGVTNIDYWSSFSINGTIILSIILIIYILFNLLIKNFGKKPEKNITCP